jgi:phage baseplate assembly protein W
MATDDERRFGRDLALPDDPDDGLSVTPTGDLQDVAGRDNLREALRRRVLVAAGSLVHRPEYGAGVTAELGSPGSATSRSRIANAVRRNLLRDDRIEDAQVTVSQGVPGDPTRSQAVTIEVSVRIRGDQRGEQFTVYVGE